MPAILRAVSLGILAAAHVADAGLQVEKTGNATPAIPADGDGEPKQRTMKVVVLDEGRDKAPEFVLADIIQGWVALLVTAAALRAALGAVARVTGVELLGLDTWYKSAMFWLNVGLFLTFPNLVFWTKHKKYSSVAMMMVVLLVKIGVCLVLYRKLNGTFIELAAQAREYNHVLLLNAVPAFFYAVADCMRVDIIRLTDPVTYELILNLRMLFLAFVWEKIMNKKLQHIHWGGLCAICIGCVTKEGGRHYLSEKADGSAFLDANRLFGYFLAFLLMILTSIGSVYNEKVLKDQPKVPPALQNIAMYTCGFIFTTLGKSVQSNLFPQGANPVASTALDSSSTFLDIATILGDPLLCLQACCMACAGVQVGYFLKVLSSVVREVACAIVVILCMPLLFFVFHHPVGAPEIVGGLVVLGGVGIFAGYPVPSNEPPKSKAEELEIGAMTVGKEAADMVKRRSAP